MKKLGRRTLGFAGASWGFVRFMVQALVVSAGSMCFVAVASAQAIGPAPDTSSIEVSLVTVGPGGEFMSWMGHTGVLVNYRAVGQSREFDYGVMLDDADTRLKVLQGTASAYLRITDGKSQIAEWLRKGRSVSLQRLNLNNDQRAELIRRLVSEQRLGKGYRYDLIDDNCTTRMRDLLDVVLGGELKRAGSKSTGLTVRQFAYKAITKAWVISALDFLMNDRADRAASGWDVATLPLGLKELVAASSMTGTHGRREALVGGFSLLRPANIVEEPAASESSPLVAAAVIGSILLVVASVARSSDRWVRIVAGLNAAIVVGVFGIGAIMLCAGWLFTEYAFFRGNENLLVAGSLLVIALTPRFLFGGEQRSLAGSLIRLMVVCSCWLIAYVGIKSTPAFDQDNWRTLIFAVPLAISLSAASLILLNRSPGKLFRAPVKSTTPLWSDAFSRTAQRVLHNLTVSVVQ